MKKKILLTGCAGFIGSNFVKSVTLRPNIAGEYDFVIVDALTYAGHYQSIRSEVENSDHLSFIQLDIRQNEELSVLFQQEQFSGVINFAAESHVDRSIVGPSIFVETNVLGTLNLLQASLDLFKKNPRFRFLQISTDEVYGSLNDNEAAFTENSPLDPSGPYSASKASADLLALSFFKTYKLPVTITRCSNNYGPYQFPEKFIPVVIHSVLNDVPIPVYGKGENIRDWIYVDDHNLGTWQVFQQGTPGEVYNLGGNSEIKNIDLVKLILNHLGKSERLISFVTDRLGHDYRYAIDYSKVNQQLSWRPTTDFSVGIQKTCEWYQQNIEWVKTVSDLDKNGTVNK